MTNLAQEHIRVLGIAASALGIGYAVMESGNTLASWGTKRARGDKNGRSLSHATALIAQFEPNVIVLEATGVRESRRRARVQALNDEIAKIGRLINVEVKRFSRTQLRIGFFPNETGTKHDMALHLANYFPEELGLQVPRKRNVATNEDHRMDMFDAVAMAYHFFRSQQPVQRLEKDSCCHL